MRVLLPVLALVIGAVSTAQKVREAAIRFRFERDDIHHEDDAGVPASSIPTNAPTRWDDLPTEEALLCVPVQDELAFRSIIAAACVTRTSSGYGFYYQLHNGRIMRNCNCSSYSDGVAGVDLGRELGRLPNVRCFAKNTTRTFPDVARVFNQTALKCHAREFL